MNFIKKGLALGMAVVMAGSFAACSAGSDTNWVAQSGDLKVPAGIYIWQLLSQYYNVQATLGADVKNPLKETVDGVAVPDKLKADAKTGLNEYIAVEKKFDELGLTLDQATRDAIAQDADGYWGYIGASYEKNGISKDSYAKMIGNDEKKTKIFESIYGEGGSEAVPDSELKEKFLKDYAKVIIIPLDFSTSEDPAQVETDNKAANEMVDKYLQKLKDGANMEDVVYEARKEVEKDDTLAKPEAGTSYTFVSRDSSPYAENVTEAIFAAKNGEPTKAASEDSVYLFVRYDISESENDFVSRKSAILQQLKFDEYTARIKEWGVALTGVTYNEAAFNRYTPSKLKLN